MLHWDDFPHRHQLVLLWQEPDLVVFLFPHLGSRSLKSPSELVTDAIAPNPLDRAKLAQSGLVLQVYGALALRAS